MLIYKQYDQAALDRQYNNRLQVPEWSTHLQRWADTSREAEKKYSPVKNIAYGEGSLETLDIFPSSQPDSKVLVFIHGGYWHKLDKSDFQFVGEGFHSYNITIVNINYPLAPSASMDQIVNSCRMALQWVVKNIRDHNGDPTQLYLCGYSAGGHLVTMMMTNDFTFADWVPLTQNVRAVCSLSGLFNLEPIRLSEINEVLHLDGEIVLFNSPIYLKPVLNCPLLLVFGGNESDEFKTQSSDLFEKWKGQTPVELIAMEEINHYSIIEEAARAGTPLHEKIKSLMGV
jgi:arylformamidase